MPALLLALLCRCLQPLRGPSPTAHHLLTELSSLALAIELEAAPAQCGSAKPRIVHGHCSEFCNTELRAVIKVHDLPHIRTRARHPESNGIVKRFTGTVRQDRDDYYGGNYLAAERLVTQLIDEYNNHRLHAALAHFEPRDLHFGNTECRREGRR